MLHKTKLSLHRILHQPTALDTREISQKNHLHMAVFGCKNHDTCILFRPGYTSTFSRCSHENHHFPSIPSLFSGIWAFIEKHSPVYIGGVPHCLPNFTLLQKIPYKMQTASTMRASRIVAGSQSTRTMTAKRNVLATPGSAQLLGCSGFNGRVGSLSAGSRRVQQATYSAGVAHPGEVSIPSRFQHWQSRNWSSVECLRLILASPPTYQNRLFLARQLSPVHCLCRYLFAGTRGCWHLSSQSLGAYHWHGKRFGLFRPGSHDGTLKTQH